MSDQTPERPQRSQLTRATWIDAALTALRAGGPEAVAVQPLAASLGATKGSFYWHFRNREELLQGALDRWRDGTLRVIEEIDALAPSESPHARLRRMLERVTRGVSDPPGEQRILAGVHDPVVHAVVADVTGRRIESVTRLFTDAGLPRADAERRAFHAYAWFLGYAQLAVTQPAAVPGDLDRVMDDLIDTLLPRS